jgi:hypothetical protein
MNEQDSEDLNFLVGFLLISVIIVLCGIGAFFSITGSADEWQKKCKSKCAEEDKDYIVPPPGTTGRTIDGGLGQMEPIYQCLCVKRPAK